MKQHTQYNRINTHVLSNLLHKDLLSILRLLNATTLHSTRDETIIILFLYIYEHALRNIRYNLYTYDTIFIISVIIKLKE